MNIALLSGRIIACLLVLAELVCAPAALASAPRLSVAPVLDLESVNATVAFGAGPRLSVPGLRDRYSLTIEDRDTSEDWSGLRRDTLYFAGTQFAVIGLLYVSPQSISGWSSEQKSDYSFDRYRTNIHHLAWDKDRWWINYVLHPYWGGAYYVRASERGYGARPAFWYSVLLSTMFEFGAEAIFERPSIQDLVFTPGVGFFIGQRFMQMRRGIRTRIFAGQQLTGVDKAMLFVTDPLGAMNRGIDNLLGDNVDFSVRPMVALTTATSGAYRDAGVDLVSGLRMRMSW